MRVSRLVKVAGDHFEQRQRRDRKSTRNSSHLVISYAVFCLKKKNTHLNSRHLVISYAAFCSKKKNGHIYTSLDTADFPFMIDMLRIINTDGINNLSSKWIQPR